MTGSLEEVKAENSWQGLGLQLKHFECPLVTAMDAASATIEQAVEAGIMDEGIARQRLCALGLQRIVIANTQAEFSGCPHDSLSKEERQTREKEHRCGLPYNTVGAAAFGDSNEVLGHQLARPEHRTGFNSNLEGDINE